MSTENEKFCGGCDGWKSREDFTPNRRNKDGLQTQCRACMDAAKKAWLAKHPEKVEEYRVRSNELMKKKYAEDEACRERIKEYGRRRRQEMTPEERKAHNRAGHLYRMYRIRQEDFELLAAKQDGTCPVCLRKPKRLVVDHDHETGLIRGLLCHACNRAVGAMGDSVEGLMRAVRYLKRAKKRNKKRA